MRGKFISLEGMDGAGKSSHIDTIITTLERRGIEVVSTREPGGTGLGEKLRELLLHESMHAETEALLMFAARREHIAQLILPALERGAWVVSDRFTDASFAYQCGGRGVDHNKMAILEQWVQQDLQPDLTLLFDVPVETSVQRLAAARTPDKFERESHEFFRKIRNAYLDRAKEFPHRFRLIDGNRALEIVSADVVEIMSTFAR
ncbi:dTMP kinase [Methylobacillus caricis]|uniref:dTMP kinase n=1 Tax=Methylobacillus caricis TaxID=1971611 RepID=UPI001CFFBA21|nr:dTMP kinase [Methylobacillus caricis]MCB5187461.1 dTMP kinase [Methylobacillus caricis]